jgi:hypothetical protein
MVYKNTPKEEDTSKTPPVALRKPLPLLRPTGVRRVATQALWLLCFPTRFPSAATPPASSQGEGWLLERIHVPFRLSDLKEIKWDLGHFTDDPDLYIQAFIIVIQVFELAWKDVMLLQDQTLTSLERQRVLDQATQAGNDYHLQKSSVKPAPLEGEAEVPESQLWPKQFPGQILDGIPEVRLTNALDTISFTSPLKV